MSFKIYNKYKEMSKTTVINEFDDVKYVEIPLCNHTNLCCTPLVKAGDNVKVGTLIGKREDHFELPLYSSISGVVEGIEESVSITGKKVSVVKIKNDFKDEIDEEFKEDGPENPLSLTQKEIFELMKKYGIIGLGGSGFPTYIKYKNPDAIDTVIINGVECEPYITCDYAIMSRHAKEVIEGLKLLMKAAGAKTGIIAFKRDYKELTNAFNNAIKEDETGFDIRVKPVKDKYPAGWEVELARSVLKRRIPTRELFKYGVIVNNVSTCYGFYNAVKTNKPLTKRMVTVTGDAISFPSNFNVRAGSKFEDVVAHAGGYTNSTDVEYMFGGPMMGFPQKNLEASCTLNTGCILVTKKYESTESPCITCGACVNNCPMKLQPNAIASSFINKEFDNYIKLVPEACIECGSCSYVCPQEIQVTEKVKKGKILSLARIKKENAKKVK